MEIKPMKENVFNFIYVAAMRDAVLQKAYEGEKKELCRLYNFDGLYDCIRKFTDNVLMGGFKDQDEYDEEFFKTAKQVCKKINNPDRIIAGETSDKKVEFTFGNAQKLLNIMLKYFYITCYGLGVNREIFRFCHCPMDGIMLENVWRNRKKVPLKKSESENYTREEFLAGWGKEGFENGGYPKRYSVFQAAVRDLAAAAKTSDGEDLYPIEYDYGVWGRYDL